MITKQGYLINLIDSPGHVDFSSEVTAALRVTDGALVVCCCVEGCSVQTETVLAQALKEMIKPVLFVNKMDRYLRELQYDAETMYTKASQVIDSVNVVISQYDVPEMGDLLVSPEKGNVAMGSGFEQWGFTITQFAELYADMMRDGDGKPLFTIEKMREMLWGNWFYNKKKKTFTSEQFNKKGKARKRTFCKFVLDPIIKMCKICMEGTMEQI